MADLKGGDAFKNAELLTAALAGNSGPIADTLIINAASALYLYGRCASIEEALVVAREQLQKGAALELLNHWRVMSHALS